MVGLKGREVGCRRDDGQISPRGKDGDDRGRGRGGGVEEEAGERRGTVEEGGEIVLGRESRGYIDKLCTKVSFTR